MDDESVRLFSLSTCAHCTSTKKLLDECTVKYQFTDVDMLAGVERQAMLDDIREFNPRCTYPTIVIGDIVIIGYHEDEIKRALGLV